MAIVAARRTGAISRRLTGAALAMGLLVGGCASDEATDGATETTVAEVAPGGGRIQGPADGTEPRRGGSVVMAIEAEPEGLDPTRYAFAGSGHFVASAVYDPIATLDDTGQAVPFLAESIEPNEDNTRWTITVREGVTFHDGTPVDAEAIVANLQAHREALITQLAFQTVTEVAIGPDGRSAVISLSQPWGAFASVMSSQIGYVAQPELLAEGTLAPNPVGSGPFRFSSHVPGQEWQFDRYEDYWRKGADGQALPYLDQISFRPTPDDAKRLGDLERGDVDITYTFRPNEVLALRESGFKLVEYDLGEEEFLMMNTQAPPFDNRLARLAVGHAADSERFLAEMTRNVMQPANGPFAPGQLGYLADNGYPDYDLDEAKRLVAQYEAETGEPLAFTLLSVDDQLNISNHQFFASLFEEAGMSVTIEGMPQINLIAQAATGSYQMAAFRNFGFPDPDTDVVFWRPSSVQDPPLVSLNFPRFTDPRVGDAIDRAVAATDDDERDAAYQEVSRAFGEEVPYLWLGRTNWVLAANPRVNGIYAAANGSIQTLGAKTWIGELWLNA